MAENMTEDEVRDKAREILGLNNHGGGCPPAWVS